MSSATFPTRTPCSSEGRLIFPIPTFRTVRPLPSLGGATNRTKPMIKLILVGPHSTVACQALVDTGCDDVVFPFDLAALVGIPLSGAPQHSASGFGSRTATSVNYGAAILQL